MKEDITKFLEEADDKIYLLMKTAFILRISGACRREEPVKMTITDVEDKDSLLIVKVPDSKTHCERVFTVSNLESINIFRKYRALRLSHASGDRLFLKYANGKCINQNVGINKIGEMPSLIAMRLLKDEPKKYTGHCFRRSSATLLANAGGDIISIKRHGGWKSTTVAESYIEHSINNKIEISNKIQPSSAEDNRISEPSTSTGNNSSHRHSSSSSDYKQIVCKQVDLGQNCESSMSSLETTGGTLSSCTFNLCLHK
jgi:integrase